MDLEWYACLVRDDIDNRDRVRYVPDINGMYSGCYYRRKVCAKFPDFPAFFLCFLLLVFVIFFPVRGMLTVLDFSPFVEFCDLRKHFVVVLFVFNGKTKIRKEKALR